MKRKNSSLVSQFRRTLIWIILATVMASLITYILLGVIFLYSLHHQKLRPANYYENQIPVIEDYIKEHSENGIRSLEKKTLHELVQGETFSYQLVDENGKPVYGTYMENIFPSKEIMYENLNSTFIKDKVYIHTIPVITDSGKIDGAFSVLYSLNILTVNNGNPRLLGILLFMIAAPFLYMILFTALFSKQYAKDVIKPLRMLTNAAEQIKNNNLDFHLDFHSSNELGALCKSFVSMQNALKGSLSAQWKAEQERRETLQNLAHDLKSPLSIIKAYTEVLTDDTNTDTEQKQYLSVIEKNTQKSISLVNQMQYTAELTSADVTIEKSSVALYELLEKKKAEYEVRAKDKKVSLSLCLNPKLPPTIKTDRNKLERILDNIISNSLEYVPASGKIEIKAEADDKYIYYSVSDNGPGFSAKDLNKALERFYRGDEARSGKDAHSGLGLYIVKQLSHLLGGSVEISNTKAGGAYVKFWHTYE